MILTKPVIFQEGVDKATNQPVISITAPDAPDPIDGQPCGVSLVFADVQALRHFARRLLATAYAIAHGHFAAEPVQAVPVAPAAMDRGFTFASSEDRKIIKELIQEVEEHNGSRIFEPMLVSRYTESCPKDPEECAIMTVEDFIASVRDGSLIDYDGYGNPMKEGRIDPRCYVSPSNLNSIPEDATHIAWYNK
jgi:hypothetical protein